MSKGYKIFLAIAAPILSALFGWLAMLPFLQGRTNETGYVIFFVLLGGSFSLFFLCGLFWTFKARLEIYPDKIISVGLFKTKEILLSEIAGFKILATNNGQYLLFLPNKSTAKKIKTEFVFERRDELLVWLRQNLTDLDAKHIQEEMNQVRTDSRLGETEEQRLWLLGRAKKWAIFLNVFSYVVLFWTIIPVPYNYAIGTSVLLPWVVLCFIHYFDGLLKLDGEVKSAFPNVVLALWVPCFGLSIRAVMDFNILNWDRFWLPFVVIALSSCLLAFLLDKDARRRRGAAIVVVIFCVIYGDSTTVILNGILDTSVPNEYQAQIVGKWISRGKHTSYCLKLSPWGTRATEKEVDVGKVLYDRYSIGDYAAVLVKDGKLGIPWFYVR